MEKENVFIDDSGWGCPIGGTLVGIYYESGNVFDRRAVDVKYYQNPFFENKAYLDVAGEKVIEMFKAHNIQKHVNIFLCTGYVNNGIPEALLRNGYKDPERCKIGEPLQSYIEEQFKKYMLWIGCDKYYDPSKQTKFQTGMSYNECLKWLKDNNKYNIAKTGWKAMQKILNNRD